MADRKLSLEVIFGAVDKASAKISGINEKALAAAKGLSQAKKELGQLNAVQKDVSSFIKLKKAVGENTAKLAEAQAKVRALATQMHAAEKPTREMERAFGRAKKEAAALSGKVDADAQALQRMRDRLASAGVATRNLADDQKTLKKRIADATENLEKQKGAYAEVMANRGGGGAKAGPGSVTDKAVKAGLILGTIKEVGNIIAAPVIADANAQEQLTQIGIKAGLSREKLKAMRDEIDRLAPQVRKTTEELRGGVDFLAASGLNPEAALKMMAPIGKASHAYKAEIEDLAKASNAALSGLKIPLGPGDIDRTRQTARVLDMMAVAGNEGNFEIADMARNFPALTAQMSALHQQGIPAVAGLAAGLEVAWKATGNADEAANNIKNLLMKINSKETIGNFQKFGIDLPKAMQKAYAEGKGPLEAIAALTQKATGGNQDKISFLFGDQQAQMGVLSLIQNMQEFVRIRDKALAQGTIGQVDRDFARRIEDTSSRWAKLEANWHRFLEGAGEGLRGVTNGALAGLNAIFETASDVAAKNSQKIGENIGEGMARGIESKRGRVQAAAATLATAAPVQARKSLAVRSPSRVFMAIGGYVSEGFALGIEGGRPQAVGAAARLAASVSRVGFRAAPAVVGGARPATATAAPITINVHGAPGHSVDQLAEAVMRKLEAAQRRTALSSYGDQT